MNLPRYSSKRSPVVFIEWVTYLNVKTFQWHLEPLFASSFATKDKAMKSADRVRAKIENQVVTLMMIGNHEEADKIDMIHDVEPRRIPKLWPKDRRKVPHRVLKSRSHWPFNKSRADGKKVLEDKSHEKDQG